MVTWLGQGPVLAMVSQELTRAGRNSSACILLCAFITLADRDQWVQQDVVFSVGGQDAAWV